MMASVHGAPAREQTLREQIAQLIESLPEDHLSLGSLLDLVGDKG